MHDRFGANHAATTDGLDMHIGAALDSTLRFQDLWTYVAYEYAFTVWTFQRFNMFTAARRGHAEELMSHETFAKIQRDVRANKTRQAGAVNELRHIIQSRQNTGMDAFLAGVRDGYDRAFAARWRPRVLAFTLRVNPFYFTAAPELLKPYAAIEGGIVNLLRELGYNAVSIGADWSWDDFVDEGHLMPAGGRRLATELAPEIRAIAARLGYLKP